MYKRQGITAPYAVGSEWQASVPWRGRKFDVTTRLTGFDPNEGLAFESQGKGVTCHTLIDLIALSRRTTRLFVSVDMKPKTLAARLFLRSLKLAKPRLSDKFKARVSEMAGRIEG